MLLFLQQLKVLLWKNYLICIRSWKLSLLRIFLPTLFIFFYYAIVAAANKPSALVPAELIPMPSIPKCANLGPGCVSLLYAPDIPFIRDVMTYIAQHNDPVLTVGPDGDIQPTPYTNPSDLNKMLFNASTSNYAHGALIFNDGGNSNNGTWNYTVLYHYTEAAQSQNALDFISTSTEDFDIRLSIQAAAEQALLALLTDREVKVKLNTKDFPDYNVNDQDRNTIVDSIGMLFYFLGLTGPLIAGMNGIATERERRIRGYLRCAGVLDSMFWISWFIELFVFHFVSVLFMLLFAYVLPDLAYFQNSNFFANFFIFNVYGIELICLSFFMSTFCNTSRLANILGLVVYFAGMIMSLVFSFGADTFYTLWDPKTLERHWPWAKILSPFPPFLFDKAVNDVSVKSIKGLLSFSTTPPPGYKFADMQHHPDTYGYAPTTADTLGLMILYSFIFLFLAWYLDNVISDTYGARRMPWFPFTPSFWGFKSAGPYGRPYPTSALGPNPAVNDEDIRAEQGTSPDSREALKIVALTKTYKKWFGNDVLAVKNFYLKSDSGVLLALLGHNGAGKTTTISVLTGLCSATSGDAYVFGYSVTHDMDEIRAISGTCPQFDVFWPELTAEEHMRIIGGVKQANKVILDSEIFQRLGEVRLLKVKDHQVETYSGGMRRRLSVAMSTVGNPKVVILDEPTTGVDPANRRYIWKMIQDLKKDRLVILTTHSMEEADVLGDKIAIMARGELKCVGTSLHLKSKFGTGYRLNFIADAEKIEPLKGLISRMLPEATLFADNAGSLIYSLPEKFDSDPVSQFFTYMQDTDKESRLARDWGVSNTTLEDVFLRVTM